MQRLYALPVIVLLLFGLSGAQAADDNETVEAKLFKVQLFLAKNGDPAGQYYLAEMYEKGLGTPQDMQQALIWYKKSAELGNPKAEEKLANWDKSQENARKAKERAEAEAAAAELAKVRQQEEADAAAKARARAATEATRKAAEQTKAAELAKVKQQEEADAAAKAAKARAATEAARKPTEESAMPKTTTTTSGPAGGPKTVDAKNPAAGQTPAAKEKAAQSAAKADAKDNKGSEGFTTNPCKGPQAKFLSTCQ